MRALSFFFALAGVVWVGTTFSRGQMLSGSLQTAAGDVVNLSSSYGFAAYTTMDGVPYTDLSNLAQFSSLSGTIANEDLGSQIELSFNGIQGTTTASANDETVLIYANAGKTLTMTSTLFAAAETFDFYVASNTGSTTLTAVLTNPANPGTPLASYTESSILGPTNAGSNFNGYGDLTLEVGSAQVGDLLTFSIENTNFGYAALQGVAVVAGAPEPSTYALMLVGAALVVVLRLRRVA